MGARPSFIMMAKEDRQAGAMENQKQTVSRHAMNICAEPGAGLHFPPPLLWPGLALALLFRDDGPAKGAAACAAGSEEGQSLRAHAAPVRVHIKMYGVPAYCRHRSDHREGNAGMRVGTFHK